jgi:hypothetical protein
MKLLEKLKNLFGKTKGRYHWFIGNRNFLNYVILRKDNYEWLEEAFNRNSEIHACMDGYVQSEYKAECEADGLLYSIFREEKDWYGNTYRVYVVRLTKYSLNDEVIAKSNKIVKLLNEIRAKKESQKTMI